MNYAYGNNINIEESIVFAPGASIYADRINVNKTLFMENYASVNADIYVCPSCDFYIRNAGDVGGVIYLADGASMTQIVRGDDDLTPLDSDMPYVVFVDGARGLAWDDVHYVAGNAGALILRDAEVLLPPPAMQIRAHVSDAAPVIEIQGVLTVRLADGYEYSGAPLLQNVTGNGTVVINGPAVGGLYAYAPEFRGGDLYLGFVRETDYYKIFGNDFGRALNALRDVMPDSALLRKLDTAGDADEVNKILSHSAAVNPGVLGRPVRVMNDFMKIAAFDHGPVSGGRISARPFYITSPDFSAYGVGAQIAGAAPAGWDFGLNLYAADTDFRDSVDEIHGKMYGANVTIANAAERLWWRTVAGATYSEFDMPYVIRNGLHTGPVRGVALYGASDAGVRFDFGDAVVAAPYVGAEYDRVRISDGNHSDIAARGGIDVTACYEGVDLRYDYKFRAGINTAGQVSADAGVGMWSAADMAGLYAGMDIVRDHRAVSYMFTISAGMDF